MSIIVPLKYKKSGAAPIGLHEVEPGDQLLPSLISGLLGRSKLINGNFDHWQRNTSFAIGSGGYTTDRFWIEANAVTTPTIARTAVSPGNPGYRSNPVYAAVLDYAGNTSAAAHYFIVHQRVEDVRSFSAQPSILSFTLFNAGAAGRQISIEFLRYYGVGGSATENTFVQKVTLDAGFNYLEIPIIPPSVAGKSIGPNSYISAAIWLTGGSNFNARNGNLGAQFGQVVLSAIQWELGLGATPFYARDPAIEQFLCQRYFEKSYDPDVVPGSVSATGWQAALIAANGYFLSDSPGFRVTKRAVPAMTAYSFDTGAVGSFTEYNTTGSIIANRVANFGMIGTRGFEVRSNGTATSGNAARYHWAADSEI